jgi:diguanylate cyclase (GGDEF)-like protein/PAS domain S-box-containing protein
MSAALHPLLLRQLKRLGLTGQAGQARPTLDAEALWAAWGPLLERISRAYGDHDQESYLLTRSQDLSSQEMAELYATLRVERDLLDSRVRDRTQALQLSEGRLRSLLSLSADWIWEQDEQLRFTYVSEGIEAASGISPRALLGRKRLQGQEFDATSEATAVYEACIDARRAFRDFTYRLVRADGQQRYVRISGEPVFDAGGNFSGYRGVGRDVTEAMLAEQKVHELARYDSLTGLPNRNMFLGELDRTIARSRRDGSAFALCFIDLDHFKTINDRLGHSAGDELLRTMARRLSESVRQTDLVARLGGDEFVVLLDHGGSPVDLSHVAQKLLNVLGQPLSLHGCTFLVTASIGIGRYPEDGDDAATLLRHADAAMYLAKGKGKNNIQFYTAELAGQAARQFELESSLRLALARNELLLHYQPQRDVHTGHLLGVEALVRWLHPVRGLVSPGEFIPLAEERGLIVPLGRWVIQTACQQIREWREAGLVPPTVAVNVSARQFADDGLVDDIREAMRSCDVPPGGLTVELTESVLMADPERAAQVLHQLRDMGLHIAIDDFGTGYSSLSYLRRFPAGTVKIDLEFIRGLPHDHGDVAITTAVISMAHSLGMRVVAEGVENTSQLEKLRELSCDEAQGFLLGRPVAALELNSLLPQDESARCLTA